MRYVIIADSACDLSQEQSVGVCAEIVPLSYCLDGIDYPDNDKNGAALTLFYNKIREGVPCTTSAVNADAFSSAFEKYLKNGQDILYIAFSSVLSSTCNNARVAAEELKERE
jgi:fatty acid-binding protein DegV